MSNDYCSANYNHSSFCKDAMNIRQLEAFQAVLADEVERMFAGTASGTHGELRRGVGLR